MRWKVKYDRSGLAEWWTVTDGKRNFVCETEKDAKWLALFLSARSVGQDEPEEQKVQSIA